MGHLDKMTNWKVGVIDLGLGNIGSVSRSITRIGISADILSSPSEYSESYKTLIMPGVGNFSYAMKSLSDTGLREIIVDCQFQT